MLYTYIALFSTYFSAVAYEEKRTDGQTHTNTHDDYRIASGLLPPRHNQLCSLIVYLLELDLTQIDPNLLTTEVLSIK